MRARKLVLAALAVSAIALGGTASAMQPIPKNGDPVPLSTRMALQKARISMPTAILKAEKRTGGKAFDARLLSAAGGPVYLISVKDPHGPGVIGVKVDATHGQVFGEPEKMHIEDASARAGT